MVVVMTNISRSLLALLLATILLVAGTSVAEREEDDKVLVAGEHVAIAIELEKGDEIDIRIFVAVTDGPEIDVFWMTEENYNAYRFDEEFKQYEDYSVKNSTSVDTKFTWDGEGTYFVVIDNTISGTVPPVNPEYSTATLHYVVTWKPVETTSFRDYVVYTILAVMVVFVIFLGYRYTKRSK
jgi:hypothetical protein